MRAVVDRPIGIFDSGFGGLTVARALFDLLPGEDYVYIGDTGRYPYGSKPLDEVRGYASQLATSLVEDFDVKAVVVACNTATAAGLGDLRSRLAVPIIDVVAPGAQALVQASTSGRIGVIGTVGTISSGAYLHAVAAAADDLGRSVDLHGAACPGFVEFVERGQTTGDEVMVLAERLLAPVRSAGIDTLLLGCTHYPFLARTISEVMGSDVVLVSSADETAFAARRHLGGAGLLREPRVVDGVPIAGTRRFLSSGDVEMFRELGARLLGPELDRTERWPLATARPRPIPGDVA